MSIIKIFPDPPALAHAAAETVTALAAEAVAARGRFSIGLSGGSTPRPLYELLAGEPFAPRIEWSNVHVFWGDERCVPPDDEDSNYRMTREALLDHVPLPLQNIHRVQGELPPPQAATAYEQDLHQFFSEPRPRFDLLLQGMGGDGHTASLFPGTQALHEQQRWAVENYVQKLDSWRVTLTACAINAAAHVIFLVDGTPKAEALRAVLRGLYMPETYPSQLVQPSDGDVVWMVDSQAAALL